MKSRFVQNLAQFSLILVVTSFSARAEYLYDSYHATGVADAEKLIQVELIKDPTGQNPDAVEIRKLCRDSGVMRDCADPIRLPYSRLQALAQADREHLQQVLDSFKQKPADRDDFHNLTRSEKLATGGASAIALGFAYPPAAPGAMAVGVALLAASGAAQAIDKAKVDRLVAASPNAYFRALNEDVQVSDYQRRDVIDRVHDGLVNLLAHESDIYEYERRASNGSPEIEKSSVVAPPASNEAGG